MPFFAIAIDLKDLPRPQRLWSALEAAGAAEILECVWLLRSSTTTRAVSDSLSALLAEGQSVRVIEVRHSESWARIAAQWRKDAPATPG